MKAGPNDLFYANDNCFSFKGKSQEICQKSKEL